MEKQGSLFELLNENGDHLNGNSEIVSQLKIKMKNENPC
jgi:hypothetical protein